jgi:hypothetical protein
MGQFGHLVYGKWSLRLGLSSVASDTSPNMAGTSKSETFLSVVTPASFESVAIKE